MDDALKARTLRLVAQAPAWVRHGSALFVHGGFHTAMLQQPSPDHGLERPQGALARALYGEPTGRMQPDGYPERSLRWVDRIPGGLTVYCGHDRRSHDGRPYVRHGVLGGTAVSWIPGQGREGICHGLTWDKDATDGRAYHPGVGATSGPAPNAGITSLANRLDLLKPNRQWRAQRQGDSNAGQPGIRGFDLLQAVDYVPRAVGPPSEPRPRRRPRCGATWCSRQAWGRASRRSAHRTAP